MFACFEKDLLFLEMFLFVITIVDGLDNYSNVYGAYTIIPLDYLQPQS